MLLPLVIGIDIGGTSTKLGLVDAEGHILDYAAFDTRQYPDIESYVSTLCQHISRLTTSHPEGQIQGIGIGAPNGNYYNGSIQSAANLPWKGTIPLTNLIAQHIDLPIILTNDANAAAMGEMIYGAAKGLNDFIEITLGTGVGSGIVCNGKLVYGHDGLAGELGHVIVKRNGRNCGCGRRGCLETYCSATGVAKTARLFLRKRSEDSLLRRISPDALTSKNVYEAACKGDSIAQSIFEYTGTLLGEAFANFIAFSSPSAIILFGGLAQSGELLLQPIRKAMDANVLGVYRGGTQILISTLKGSDAAILGSSALAWS